MDEKKKDMEELDELLKKQKADRNYFFLKPVGQIIEHVDTINFSMDKDGNFHFENVGQVNKQNTVGENKPKERIATKEMMSKAMLKTLRDGYWKAARAWAIVYQVYCIWGYKGTQQDFIEEVKTWPDVDQNRYVCNRDAATKLSSKYNFSKDIKKWKNDGVMEVYCILGEKLNDSLEEQLGENKDS